MLTFQDQYQLAQGIAGVNDATNTTNFKRDINQGGIMFLAQLGRNYNRKQRKSDIVANQQYYQLPEDALRIIELVASTGTQNIPLTQVADEHQWLYLNQTTVNGVATHYFVRGFDEFGLYPIPTGTITKGLTLIYEPKHIMLTKDDFTTGSVTVTNGSNLITHSANGFTADMVGRYFQNSDGTDGKWYKIISFQDTNNLIIENFYQGNTETTTNFRIGQVMDMPEEFLEAPVDYAMYRHYLKKGNNGKAGDFRTNFQNAVDAARNAYGVATQSQVVWGDNQGIRPYNFIKDTPNTIPHS